MKTNWNAKFLLYEKWFQSIFYIYITLLANLAPPCRWHNNCHIYKFGNAQYYEI